MKIIFAGTPHFSVSVLTALIEAGHDVCAVYTQPDRPKGRGRQVAFSPVKETALAHNLTVCQPLSLKDEAEHRKMASFNADVMVVVAYGLILPKSILDLPLHGCLNVHASLLPLYRGASPIQAALLKGDSESGVTIMQMDVGLDTGDMILKKTCPIDINDTSQHLHDALSILGAKGLIEALEKIENKTATFETQDDSLANYAGKIKKSDALIDWNQTADEIHNQVRAYYGWPVSYSQLNTNIIRIWETEIVSMSSLTPGEILEVGKASIIVACGKGALLIKKLQLPNSKPMAVHECLNSKRSLFVVGEIFS